MSVDHKCKNAANGALVSHVLASQAEDVQSLFAFYGNEGVEYHEIQHEEILDTIRNRWPLVKEISDQKKK